MTGELVADPVFRASLIGLVSDLRHECDLDDDHAFLNAVLSDEQLLAVARRLRVIKARPGIRFQFPRLVR